MSPAFSRALTALSRSSQLIGVIDRDAGDLRGGVDPGVGAAGRVQRVMGPDDGRDLVFDHRLNALRVRLPLPSGVGRAVVGDRELQGARHGLLAAYFPREPGLTTGEPALQSGQSSGW